MISIEIYIREFNSKDCPLLPQLCNNIKIWNNVRDYFPHPYTLNDAEEYINFCQKQNPDNILPLVLMVI